MPCKKNEPESPEEQDVLSAALSELKKATLDPDDRIASSAKKAIRAIELLQRVKDFVSRPARAADRKHIERSVA